MSKIMCGIDVSTHQGNISWGEVKGKIDFAIIRAGYGKNNIDARAKQNVQGCEANGIPFGLYWFSYAYTVEMARKEAQYLLAFVKGHTPLLPLYFDFEYDSDTYAKKNGVTVTKKLLCEMATAFCEELENAGYYAGIYANNDYVKNKYGEDIFKRYDLWFARWGCEKPGRSVHLWQYTDKGRVSGINGNVDKNYAYIDFPELIKKRKLNGYTPFVCPLGYTDCPHSKE